ncbi:hypothetical protein [Microbacterium trichothecenolyticum]|uniref:Uncharacterized protein n=1 Tax=Microbacterium trichothecenolyticum TaxID=69370 RepID=A0ABU0TSG7_MICTR|nr:hypothetical protein [Microbacterium trichothecenolyticum]MDQ1122621.1 hypothetical protein [Microbacterium trichothecenolyticum]
MKRLATAAALVITVLSVSACAPSPSEGEGLQELPDVSIEGYESVSAVMDYETGTVQLPLDQYSLQSPAVQTKTLQAIATRTDACLEDLGFHTVSERVDWTPFPAAENRRYGVWSVERASRFGYGAPEDVGINTLRVNTLDLGVEFNEAFASCNQEAVSALQPQIDFLQAPNIDYRIRSQAERRAESSAEGAQAREQWQNCMKERGIVLDATSGFPSQQYNQQGKEAEIAAATTQAECASQTGAIQTLFDLQARYEAAFIDSQAAAVQEFAAARETVLSTFNDVIAGR